MSAKPRYRKEVPISKKLLLYRNGDKDFRPVEFVYNSYFQRNFDKVLEDVGQRVPPRNALWGHGGSGVRTLWSPDGSQKISTIEELQAYDSEIAVVGGPEKFKNVEGGYENIRPKSKEGKEEDNDKKEKPEETNYRELNKKRYGDQERSKEDKIYNRYKPAPVKKITVLRNKDKKFKPKSYTWKTKQVSTLDALSEELRRMAPPKDNGPTNLYSVDGKPITDLEQIEDGGTYVVAGEQAFDLEGSDLDRSDDDADLKGKDDRGDDKSDRASGDGTSQSRNQKNKGKHSKEDKTGWKNIGKDEEPDWKKIDEEDRLFLEQYYQNKSGEKRRNSQKVFNRKDQVHPEILIIYVFLNGDGQSAEVVHLKPQQLLRGMPYVLEVTAKRYTVNPKCLCTLGGEEIEELNELDHRGAYVLVPWGETYRDSWFYLPKNAIDTSNKTAAADDSADNGDSDKNKSRRASTDSRTEADRDQAHQRRNQSEVRTSSTSKTRNNTSQSDKKSSRGGKDTASSSRAKTSSSQETNPSTRQTNKR